MLSDITQSAKKLSPKYGVQAREKKVVIFHLLIGRWPKLGTRAITLCLRDGPSFSAS